MKEAVKRAAPAVAPIELRRSVRLALRDPEAVDEWCGHLSTEAPVFVYCAYGFEVGCNVATALRQRGFDARYIRGGLAAWHGAEGARRR